MSTPSAAIGAFVRDHEVSGMSRRIAEHEAGSAVHAVPVVAGRVHVKDEVVQIIAKGKQ